jgi:uncharacterized protein (TIGR00255 family)
MYSMTGYGKANITRKKLSASVELFSVNSRFLEFTFRLPKQLSFLEPKIKELISSRINRGKITVAVNYADYGTGIDQLVVNENMTDEIYVKLLKLKKKYKLSGEIDINHFLEFPDIFKIEKTENVEKVIWPVVKTAANKALTELIGMRSAEGNNLKKDLNKRLKILVRQITKIEKFAPENRNQYREKLAKRIEEVLSDGTVNGKKLEEEVAFLAERSDITEECVRFRSHIDQFEDSLKNGKTIGKRLNFILQEFNREANTIAAKAGGSEISNVVLELKEEIEKMREQVQNIE